MSLELQNRNLFIGIDPGTFTGFGIIQGGKLINYGQFKFNDPEEIQKAYRFLFEKRNQLNMGIESQYIGYASSENSNPSVFESIRKVSMICGWWVVNCKMLGIPFEEINPRTWQSKILSKSHFVREEGKRISKKIVLLKYNVETKNDNIADGINIARFFYEKSAFNWLVKKNASQGGITKHEYEILYGRKNK